MDFEQQQQDIAKHIGELLIAAREKTELTVAAVADQLHLKQSFVRALESGDYQVIDSMVYVKGYLRTYTRLLQLDLDDRIAQLKLEAVVPMKAKTEYAHVLSGPAKVAKLNTRRIKHTFRQKKKWLVAIVVIIILLLIALNWHDSTKKSLALPSLNSAPVEMTHKVLLLPPVTSVQAKPLTHDGDEA